MTPEDAAKMMRLHISFSNMAWDCFGTEPEIAAHKEGRKRDIDACLTAIDALTKQMPMAIGQKYGVLSVCPACGITLVLKRRLYCYNCGQALDWSEDK